MILIKKNSEISHSVNCPTPRALDAGDSVAFSNSFLRLFIFQSDGVPPPAPAPVTQTVSRLVCISKWEKLLAMKRNSLQEIGENVKSQHRYWEALSPEERRTEVVRMVNAQTKSNQNSVKLMAIMGSIFLAIGIIFWSLVFKMNLSSTLGLAGGLIMATIGFNVLNTNKIGSYRKILSNHFDDNDVIAFFREHENINQRFLERWNKSGKYILLISFGIGAFLLYNPSTKAFMIVSLEFGIGLFLIGAIFILSPFQKRKDRNQKNSGG